MKRTYCISHKWFNDYCLFIIISFVLWSTPLLHFELICLVRIQSKKKKNGNFNYSFYYCIYMYKQMEHVNS